MEKFLFSVRGRAIQVLLIHDESTRTVYNCPSGKGSQPYFGFCFKIHTLDLSNSLAFASELAEGYKHLQTASMQQCLSIQAARMAITKIKQAKETKKNPLRCFRTGERPDINEWAKEAWNILNLIDDQGLRVPPKQGYPDDVTVEKMANFSSHFLYSPVLLSFYPELLCNYALFHVEKRMCSYSDVEVATGYSKERGSFCFYGWIICS